MTRPTSTLIHSILVTILVIISGSIIFYQFPSVPQNISFDETEFVRLALSLEGQPYAPYSKLATGHSTPYFYILLGSIKLFGLTPFALRFPSALFGVLGVITFYFLLLQIFTKEYIHQRTNSSFLTRHLYLIPFLLSCILASFRWYFNFARFGFEATFLLFLELMALYFFFAYKNNKKSSFLIASGIFTGLAYNSYTPGRLFFIVPVFFLFTEFRHGLKKIHSRIVIPFVSFLIPFFIVIAPLTWYLSIHPDIRINQLSYVTNDKMKVPEKIEFGLDNVNRLVKMFHVKGDTNGRHNYPGKPALNPILGFFFAIGLIYSCIRFKEYNNMFFLSYFVLSLAPMFLTYPWENPNMLRSFTVIPSIIFFVGNAVLLLYKLRINSKVLTYIFFIIFAISGIYELRTYFIYQATIVFPYAFEISPLLFPTFVLGSYKWLYKF